MLPLHQREFLSFMDAIVLYSDTRVYEPEYFEREDLRLKLKGQCDKDFAAPFDWVKENDVDPICLIYLTELECNNFPGYKPSYPVI